MVISAWNYLGRTKKRQGQSCPNSTPAPVKGLKYPCCIKQSSKRPQLLCLAFHVGIPTSFYLRPSPLPPTYDLHRSPYLGFSVNFAEYRQYRPGDDIRRIDWKVYGRLDRFFVKEYEGETNTGVQIILDCSHSMA